MEEVLVFPDRYVRYMEVSMNMTAPPIVIFVRSVAGPALPNIVWLEAPPPKVEPIVAPFPTWRSTTITMMMLTVIWMTVTSVYMTPPNL